MTGILSVVVPALIPAVADGLRGVFNKLTGGAGAKPANKTYYPYVKECPGGWQTVPAEPPSEQGR